MESKPRSTRAGWARTDALQTIFKRVGLSLEMVFVGDGALRYDLSKSAAPDLACRERNSTIAEVMTTREG